MQSMPGGHGTGVQTDWSLYGVLCISLCPLSQKRLFTLCVRVRQFLLLGTRY